MTKLFKILGEYKGKVEELDEVEARRAAEEIAREMRMIYGDDWRIWVEEDDE